MVSTPARLLRLLLVSLAAAVSAGGCGGERSPLYRAECAPGGMCDAPFAARLADVADAAGLTPLRTTPLPGGHRELRFWIGADSPRGGLLLRLEDAGPGTAADGALFDWWPTDSGSSSRWGRGGSGQAAPPCPEGASHAHGMTVCPFPTTRQARWGDLLRQLELRGVWTLPGSEAPGTPLPAGRAGMPPYRVVVEARSDSGYRSYGYGLPRAGDSATADIEAILRAIHAFTVTASSGRPPSAGRPAYAALPNVAWGRRRRPGPAAPTRSRS
ncbi:MAG TPA: hypothetical protein VKA84_17815 [Gemmatimonadaceae bacterium]|nr:hypothetical protein [Gemmatimonadaceae bacterium]